MVRGHSTRRIATATLFGVFVFVSKIVIPTPIDKMFVAPQALFLALSSLLIRPLGATYVATVAGFLSAVWRAPFAPFTIAFASTYGLLVDAFCHIFKVRGSKGGMKTRRLVGATTLSTAIVGLLSYYVTVFAFTLLPSNPVLELAILVVGVLNGVIAGYTASLVWTRTIKRFVME